MLVGRFGAHSASAGPGRSWSEEDCANEPGYFPCGQSALRGYAGWHSNHRGALTFFPVLVLGPILEQLMILEGRTF
jgi:hypothetical protein